MPNSVCGSQTNPDCAVYTSASAQLSSDSTYLFTAKLYRRGDGNDASGSPIGPFPFHVESWDGFELRLGIDGVRPFIEKVDFDETEGIWVMTDTDFYMKLSK